MQNAEGLTLRVALSTLLPEEALTAFAAETARNIRDDADGGGGGESGLCRSCAPEASGGFLGCDR